MSAKRVFIASPLRGNYEQNLALAKFLCLAAVREGFAPFAPHAFYTAFLDENLPADRRAGIDAGCAWLRAADEVWAYAENLSECSEGMKAEIGIAVDAGIPVLYMPPTLVKAKAAWVPVPK